MKKNQESFSLCHIKRQLLYIFFAVLVASSSSMSAFADQTFNSFPISSAYAYARQIIKIGTDSWYTEGTGNNPISNIGKMTSDGVVADYDIRALSGNMSFNVAYIVAGPDGNLWFNGYAGSTIYTGFINTVTNSVTLYPTSRPSYLPPSKIVLGADGNLWYFIKSAEAQNYTYIMKVNPQTGIATIGQSLDYYADLSDIASSIDGKIWYIDNYYHSVNSFAVTGPVAGASYSIPSWSYSSKLAVGSNGTVWFVKSEKIIKLSMGNFAEYTPPGGIDFMTPDDSDVMWFVDNSGSIKKIGRITETGVINEYSVVGTSVGNLSGLSVGQDGSLWFSYIKSGVASLGKAIITRSFSANLISSSYNNAQQTIKIGEDFWYMETNGNNTTGSIGKLSSSGVITDYDIRSLSGKPNFNISSIVAGPNGNLWFNGSASSTNYAGFLNITTGTVSVYVSSKPSYSDPSPLILGADGNLWYFIKSAEAQNYTYIMKVNPTNGTISVGRSLDNYSNISSMNSGPDGRLWYIDNYYHTLNAFSVTGPVLSNTYTIPNWSYAFGVSPGSDGNVWFLRYGTVSKVTTLGIFTQYTPPVGVSPWRIAIGPDKAIWFTDTSGGGKIGSIDTNGVFNTYPMPTTNTGGSNGLVLGADGAIWYSGSNRINRFGY